MNLFENNFSRKHLFIFLVILILFTIANFAITSAGLDDGQNHYKYVFLTTAATFTGPMTGAISRQWQSCCTEFSLKIMMFCAPALLLGILFQLIRLPFKKSAAAIRFFIWIVSLLIWFLGGILSFAHALE
jgi:hypothetical protein